MKWVVVDMVVEDEGYSVGVRYDIYRVGSLRPLPLLSRGASTAVPDLLPSDK